MQSILHAYHSCSKFLPFCDAMSRWIQAVPFWRSKEEQHVTRYAYLVNWPCSLCHVYMHLSKFYSHFQLYVWVWKFTRFLKTKSAFLSQLSKFHTTDDLFLFISIMLQFYLETFTGKIKLSKKHPLPFHIQIRHQAWTEFHFNSTKTTKWKKKSARWGLVSTAS